MRGGSLFVAIFVCVCVKERKTGSCLYYFCVCGGKVLHAAASRVVGCKPRYVYNPFLLCGACMLCEEGGTRA